MAKLITPDGLTRDVTPADGKAFTLDELQGFVGGYIQLVRLTRSRLMCCNEEGKLERLPLNRTATAEWAALHGLTDVIVGSVVIGTEREMGG